jgi:cytochrome c biogenesis protein CcmG/thiol:disulfide interchange protein DsbE
VTRRPLLILAALALAAVVAVGLVQSDTGDEDRVGVLSAAQVREQVAGAPPALAALHRQGNELLRGGEPAIRERLAALRGTPVVVNVWGSWCVPCRAEFPIFQKVSVEQADRIAFLGIATQDAPEKAARFLEGVPVPFPSYLDFDGAVAKGMGLIGTPSTLFYDAAGQQAYLHQGQYKTVADLEADIRKYALGAA